MIIQRSISSIFDIWSSCYWSNLLFGLIPYAHWSYWVNCIGSICCDYCDELSRIMLSWFIYYFWLYLSETDSYLYLLLILADLRICSLFLLILIHVRCQCLSRGFPSMLCQTHAHCLSVFLQACLCYFKCLFLYISILFIASSICLWLSNVSPALTRSDLFCFVNIDLHWFIHASLICFALST